MAYEDTNINKIEDMDYVRFTITLPRSDVEDEVVEAMRARDYPDETIRMVGLLGCLTRKYGFHYREELFDPLLLSMESLGIDEEDAQAFRRALEVAIFDYRDDNLGRDAA